MSGVVSPRSSSDDRLYGEQPCCTLIVDTVARDMRLSNEEDSSELLSNGTLYCGGDTHRKHSLNSVESNTSERDAVQKDNRIINDLDENDGLSLKLKYALMTKGQNRRCERREDNRMLYIRRNNETRIVDQCTKHLYAKNENCFAPAISEDFDWKSVNHRNVHWKRYRDIAGRAQLQEPKEVGEIFISEEHKTRRRYTKMSRGVSHTEACQCFLGAPFKRAIQIVSPGGASNSGCDKSPVKQCSFGTTASSAANCGSSVELEFRSKAGHEESMVQGRPGRLLSDGLISGGVRETTTKSYANRIQGIDELFLVNCNRDLYRAPKPARFLGVIPLFKHHGKDVSLSLSTKDHLPSISAKCGTSGGQILTVVRKTVTGLEIERRSSTEIISIPNASRSCDMNSCMEYDPPRVKKRTINWVKSQRLLQSRIGV